MASLPPGDRMAASSLNARILFHLCLQGVKRGVYISKAFSKSQLLSYNLPLNQALWPGKFLALIGLGQLWPVPEVGVSSTKTKSLPLLVRKED